MAYRRLPVAPNLDHLKNQAKKLLAAYRAGEAQAVADFTEFHPRTVRAAEAQLTDAQLVLARSYRQPSWPRLASAAQIQRALHDNDVHALQRVVSEHPEALSEYLSTTSRGPSTSRAGFRESTRVRQRNIRGFLRTFARDIPLEDLEVIPRQYGASVVFYYGDDKVLKVPKNGHRQALLKEARLYEYLNSQQLSTVFPEPLFVHEKGLYAVFSRIDGQALTPATLEVFTPAELELAVQSIAAFFSCLHNHRFPDGILECIPRATDPFDVHLSRARKKVEFVGKHSENYDTGMWKERLDVLQGALNQSWAVTHCDPQLAHFFAVQGDPERLGVIDFMDAQLHDPAVDIHDFIIEVQSDLPSWLAGKVVELMLKHYRTDDPAVAEKVEYGLLEFEIRSAYQRVRASVRQAERIQS